MNTPVGVLSDTVSVSWNLISGDKYWLLQTTTSNELYTSYGGALPVGTDIQITQSGTFNDNIAQAVTNANNWPANEFWAAFNNITTGAAAVPEPSSLALLGLGAIGAAIGAYRRRRQQTTAA